MSHRSIVALIVIAVFGSGCAENPQAAAKASPAEDRVAVVVESLRALESCGIRARSQRDAVELIRAVDLDASEEEQLESILVALGSQRDSENAPFRSDDVWTLDFASIEEPGDYTFLARRIRTLSGGALEIQGIEDKVDLEDARARLSFRLSGVDYDWKATVEGDLVDRKILSRFAGVLHQHTKVSLYFVPLRGNRWLLGCATSEQFSALRALGVKAKWVPRV